MTMVAWLLRRMEGDVGCGPYSYVYAAALSMVDCIEVAALIARYADRPDVWIVYVDYSKRRIGQMLTSLLSEHSCAANGGAVVSYANAPHWVWRFASGEDVDFWYTSPDRFDEYGGQAR